MHNVTHTVVDHKLIITIDVGDQALAAAPRSASGKTKLVASTGSSTAVAYKGLTYSLNVMTK